LLGVQFFINMALVVMLVFVSMQYRKALYGEVGYDYENLLYLSLYNQTAQSSSERIKNELEKLPEVEGVEFGYELPMSGSSGNNVYIPGMTEELFNFADQYSSTKGYNSLLGIPYVEGRAPEAEGEVAVDQNFAEKICQIGNWKDGAVGKTINLTGHGDGMSMYGDPFVICGVYKNYLLGTQAGRDYRPSARFYGDLSGDYWMKECLIRVNNADRQTIDKIQKIIDDIFPESTNKEVRSYAADLRGSYDDKLKMRNTIILGCILSLIVALIGLIGYIRDESNRRSKEMAIRKINGATTNEIIGLFIKDISRIAIISAILADVLAWYASRLWLQQFSEKISLSPWVFIAGNIVVLLIITGAVVLNCLRIAKANPVESLKNE
ncbi:MAG: FtsX-like permease family protein, partial [Bacteroidales bacterium]|nr:FtsX-like permease family protein [Bacteroidales bacterium]